MNLQRQPYSSFPILGVPIRNISDYSPFGVVPIAIGMDGRTVSGDFYRRGFNGMSNDTWFSSTESHSGVNTEWSLGRTSGEKDNEFKGQGNSYTTEFRQYDACLGRWISLDLLMAKFPWQSPYVVFDNLPTVLRDPRGLEGENPNEGKEVEGIEAKDNITWGFDKDHSLINEELLTKENLSYSMELSFKENVLNPLESDNWIKETISESSDKQLTLTQILLGTEISEDPQRVNESRGADSPVYTGRILQVTTQYLDNRNISNENPEGAVDGSWKQIWLKNAFYDENSPQVLSPDGNPYDRPHIYKIDENISIKWVATVVITPIL